MEQREWDASGGLRDRLKGEEDKVKMIFYGDDDIADDVEEVADDEAATRSLLLFLVEVLGVHELLGPNLLILHVVLSDV